jgi:hypothetical protein
VFLSAKESLGKIAANVDADVDEATADDNCFARGFASKT